VFRSRGKVGEGDGTIGRENVVRGLFLSCGYDGLIPTYPRATIADEALGFGAPDIESRSQKRKCVVLENSSYPMLNIVPFGLRLCTVEYHIRFYARKISRIAPIPGVPHLRILDYLHAGLQMSHWGSRRWIYG